MASPVCVDASLLLNLVLPEPDSRLAEALWSRWLANDAQIVAPTLLAYEATSVLRSRVHRKLLSPEQGERAFAAARQLAVLLRYPAELHRRAWELSKRFGRPTSYDSHYLALAELLDCEFWTADERLYNVVASDLDWVKLLANFEPAQPTVP